MKAIGNTLLVLLTLASSAGLGCAPGGPGTPCDVPSVEHCLEGLECRAGECREDCRTDPSGCACDNDGECNGGHCVQEYYSDYSPETHGVCH